MTEDEYAHHRRTSKHVPTLGECSLMKDGRVKIEGYAPTPVEALTTQQKRALQDAGVLTP